jgi:hypothetical protein
MPFNRFLSDIALFAAATLFVWSLFAHADVIFGG